MKNMLFKPRQEIKIGEENWKFLDGRFKMRYASIESEKQFSNPIEYNTFEEIWSAAETISYMTNCTNRLKKSRYVMVNSSSGAIKIKENDFKPVKIRYVAVPLSYYPNILEIANNLSYKEFFKFWKDHELTP